MTGPDESARNWQAAFDEFEKEYSLGADSVGLFAVNLRFGLDDIRGSAADSLTGGGDDKKCDVIYLDRDRGVAVLAQCYFSTSAVKKASAPANKASDLHTALSWLIEAPLEKLPDGLRGKAVELRDALDAKQIREFHVWYVHNCDESTNATTEVANAELLARKLLGPDVNIFGKEVGSNSLERMYIGSKRAITVTEEFDIRVQDVIEVQSERWSSVTTMVPGAWLFDLFAEHKEELFSANVRDYLGSRNSDANINNGIKQTAESEPGDFAVYNNGITALVLNYSVGRRSRASRKLTVRGLSIVNGAQTTGSLGSLPVRPDEGLLVPIRFIKSSDSQLLEKIVRFNNSQNRVQAADFRSGDEVQSRLRAEFAQLKGVSYDGGRRGGASDAMKRSRSAIPHYTAGQVLTAFNGDSVTAYDKKSEIWVDDKLYSSVFGERTTARGILFSYSLYEAISSRRLSLLAKQKAGGNALTTDEADELKFLGKRGASYLLVEAVARVIEIVLDKSVSNKLDLAFDSKVQLSTAVDLWMPLLTSLMPLTNQLDSAFTSGRVKQEGKEAALGQFASMFASVVRMSEKKFPEFSGRVVQLNS